MKIKTEQLQKALSIVKPGLSGKEILEQSTSFAFLDGTVTTYNDEISICHPVEGIDFEGAIKAEELYGLLSKITRPEVDLSVEDGELRIISGRVKAGLKLEKEIKLPLQDLPGKMFKITSPERFLQFVSLAMKTCSTDQSQPKLTCVSIAKEGIIIGSDSYRLIRCMGDEMPVDSFLLPATSAVELVRINPVRVFVEKEWVHFKNKEGTVFSSRQLNDSYMDAEAIKKGLSVKGTTIQLPAKIELMLERMKQFAKRDFTLDEKVEVIIKEGKMTLKAIADGTGSWVKETATIDCTEEFSFAMTPSLFEDIIKITKSFVLDSSLTKVKFKNKDWEYVVMLHTKA